MFSESTALDDHKPGSRKTPPHQWSKPPGWSVLLSIAHLRSAGGPGGLSGGRSDLSEDAYGELIRPALGIG